MITVKTSIQIEKMRTVCKLVAETHRYAASIIKPGITTLEVDALAEEFILKAGAKPNFKNYMGYKFATCISVNDVIVHGVPNGYILQEGDIVSLDFGAVKDGWHGDAARTVPVGRISGQRQRIIDTAKACFDEALKNARAGRRVGDLSSAIQRTAEANGYSVVRNFVGHGIGQKLHEDPSIPNYGAQGSGILLKNGYTLAIEPMINAGRFGTRVDFDKWTCRTIDGKDSAHYENTVLITNDEPEILTI